MKHKHKSGRTIYVNIRIALSEYEGRKELLVTTSDITKRLEAEQQLIQASKMATLGEMATGIAHELNQPLTVIKTASNFFIKKINRKETIDEDVLFTLATEIDSYINRATRIINHMREFGRKSDMSFGRVELNTIIKKAFDIFSQQLKLRGIEVIWDLDENLPFIWGDATRLEQVFVNLLINARDAIEGKWVEVTDREDADNQEEEKKIFLRSRHKNNKVRIEVEDTGKGIDPALIDKIFEPFFTTKEVGKGTGLGLSISYGIIQECRGNIRAVSGKTRGACFIITFPVYEEDDDDLVFYH